MKQIMIAAVLMLLLTVHAHADKPLLRDFLGINGHTVQFKPDLYRPTTELVRDYHGMNWDVGDDTSRATTFPFAHNKVDWQSLYGSWRKAGYRIDASIMISKYKPNQWRDLAKDAERYGRAFAKFFGPSGRNLVQAAEVGNEPGGYDDASYRTVFEHMARGFRAGDPKLKVVTCAMYAEPSGKYHKALDCVRGLEKLYDVINVHAYPQLEGWPTWKRSYPEDARLKDFMPRIEKVIDWRNQHAPGKAIWLTEFGYDSTTKSSPAKGTFAKWVGVTDAQQAQWLVRSVLVFTAIDLDRAYIYFFNDDDNPSVHAASGLTRHYKPKPSYYAIAHLQKTLGDYRFDRVVMQQADAVYAYRYVRADGKSAVIAAWSPTGRDREAQATIDLGGAKLIRAERMPLTDGAAPKVDVKVHAGRATLTLSESPTYLILSR